MEMGNRCCEDEEPSARRNAATYTPGAVGSEQGEVVGERKEGERVCDLEARDGRAWCENAVDIIWDAE